MIEKHEIGFIHVRLFLPLPNGRDGPSPQEYEESGVSRMTKVMRGE